MLVALEGAMFAGAVAILGTFAKDLPPDSSRQDLVRLFLWALLALCFIGLTTSIVWIFMVRRGAYIGHVIERQMVDIEEFFRRALQEIEWVILGHFRAPAACT